MHPHDTIDAPETCPEAEEWRPVAGHEGWYSVSNLGRIRRDRGGRGSHRHHILSSRKNNKGYLYVDLYQHDKRTRCYIHRLVARAFLGEPPSGYEVDHRDCNPVHNAAGNLEYVTHHENLRRGTQRAIERTGQPHPNTRLSAEDVRAIRTSPLSQCVLAARYGVHQASISNIRLRKHWKHIP